MKNFYLVQAGCLYGNTYYLPYAVGMLAAYALSDPQVQKLFHLGGIIYKLDDIDTSIDSMEEPALVGFSNSIWNYTYNLDFAKSLKKRYPNCMIVFGGHHVPPDTSYLNQYDFIDVLIHGKGEEAFRDLLLVVSEKKKLQEITNISYRDAAGVLLKTREQKITTIDYPSPYLSGVFDPLLSDNNYSFSCVLETNRGCPYNCSYCDWGEIHSPVRLFPIEKVFAELEWMAAKKMDFVYCVDANFGMFERDQRIAEKIVELKQRYGYPNRLQVSYAKEEPERVFQINRILAHHGIGKGATLALQSLNKTVLENVGRTNIPKAEYVRRITQFRKEGISTYTELILGLPGETMDSFCRGLCELLELGQHSSVSAYHCELLPNARMNTKAYRKKYGIKTVCTALDQYHCKDMCNTLSGKSNIVVQTNTMSSAEWAQANYFAACVQGFHHFGLTQCLAMFAHTFHAVSYYNFYNSLLEFIENDTVFCKEICTQIKTVIIDFIHEKGGLNIVDRRFGEITWPIEEILFLRCLYNAESFYEEIHKFMIRFSIEPHCLDALFQYQQRLLLRPLESSHILTTEYDFLSFFNAIQENKMESLKKEPVMYRLSTPFHTKNWEEYAREIVWYGRRNGRMLYCNSPNKIERLM